MTSPEPSPRQINQPRRRSSARWLDPRWAPCMARADGRREADRAVSVAQTAGDQRWQDGLRDHLRQRSRHPPRRKQFVDQNANNLSRKIVL